MQLQFKFVLILNNNKICNCQLKSNLYLVITAILNKRTVLNKQNFEITPPKDHPNLKYLIDFYLFFYLSK
jgi:hypothetical protein